MKTKALEILIVVVVLFVVGFVVGCKDEAEPRAKSIYNRELTADEITRIYEDPFYEPNDGDVLIPTPSGDYIWVADEPIEPEQSR